MVAYNIEPTSTTWETSLAHDLTLITDVPTDGSSRSASRMLVSMFSNCSKLSARILAWLKQQYISMNMSSKPTARSMNCLKQWTVFLKQRWFPGQCWRQLQVQLMIQTALIWDELCVINNITVHMHRVSSIVCSRLFASGRIGKCPQYL